jgi:hypothetical protein
MPKISTPNPPYSQALVTISFNKGAIRVAFQLDNISILGRLPAVGEQAQAADVRVQPPLVVDGTVASIVTGYSADSALGILLDVNLT